MGASEQGKSGCEELIAIDNILNATDYGPDKVIFDTSIVRGLGYYTGPVFEAELVADIRDKKGRPVRIGSIGGGADMMTLFQGLEVSPFLRLDLVLVSPGSYRHLIG